MNEPNQPKEPGGGASLRQRAIRSTVWYGATRIATQGLSWVVTLVLARLLTPADYGLFAMAFTSVALFEMLQEFGLGVAIIQRRDLEPRHLDSAFWIMAAGSAVLVGIAVVAAPYVALYYHEPRLQAIVSILSLTFFLNTIGLVPYSLLTKAIDFKHRSIAEGLGTVASSLGAILLAWFQFGVWALVGGQLLRAVVRNSSLWVLAGWRPRARFSLAGMKDFFTFGINVAGSGILKDLTPVANTAILGRLLGSQRLGIYTMATTLGTNPLHSVTTGLITQLALPIFSDRQQDLESLRRYFLKISKYLATFALPLQVGMAVVGGDLVLVLLSERWHEAIGLVQVFSLGGVVYLLSLPCAPLLTARGKPGSVFLFSALLFAGSAVALFVGAPYGLWGVALAWVLTYPTVRAVLIQMSLREIGVGAGTYLRTLLTPAIATLVMAAAVLLSRKALPLPAEPAWRLAIGVAVGAASYVGSLAVIDRSLLLEIKDVLRTATARKGNA